MLTSGRSIAPRSSLRAAGVFTIGKRYNYQVSDTYRTGNQIPIRHYVDFEDFLAHRPMGAILVGVEMGGVPLRHFSHPKRVIYLLGAEDHGLPPSVLAKCNAVVSLEAVTQPSYSVAVSGSIVMYHRMFL